MGEEEEAGGAVQRHPQLHREFETSLGHTRPRVKKKKRQNSQTYAYLSNTVFYMQIPNPLILGFFKKIVKFLKLLLASLFSFYFQVRWVEKWPVSVTSSEPTAGMKLRTSWGESVSRCPRHPKSNKEPL